VNDLLGLGGGEIVERETLKRLLKASGQQRHLLALRVSELTDALRDVTAILNALPDSALADVAVIEKRLGLEGARPRANAMLDPKPSQSGENKQEDSHDR